MHNNAGDPVSTYNDPFYRRFKCDRSPVLFQADRERVCKILERADAIACPLLDEADEQVRP
jgi:hypothetical protein